MLPAGRGVAWQQPDGVVCLRATGDEAFEQLRFCLGIDDDHTPFVLRFQRDPLLGPTVRRLRGLRPIRLATVAHALLRALCGQLILASEARAMERRIIRAATSAENRLTRRRRPPTSPASRPPSCAASGSTPAAARRSPGSAARSSSSA